MVSGEEKQPVGSSRFSGEEMVMAKWTKPKNTPEKFEQMCNALYAIRLRARMGNFLDGSPALDPKVVKDICNKALRTWGR